MFGGKKSNKMIFLGALLVFVVTAIVFLPILWGEFLNWDDNVLFLENYAFRGVSAENLQWMCTTFFYGHWQPVSWFSYALDYLLWGMNPHGWHIANWFLHAVNGVLVFLLCIRALGRPTGRAELLAAVLAALFYAVHPLRVETVGWLSTRGYLLGGMFCLLTVLFYVKDTVRGRYPFLALLFFALAALTKGICMMVPPVLLLIDWMLLGRITSVKKAVNCGGEKVPFFLLSILTGVMAFLAKRYDGGMAGIDHYGMGERIVQSVYGMWFYVFKSISPQQLSPLYYKRPDLFGMVLSFVMTAFVSVLLFVFRRRLRSALAAIAASLVLIFPMIGITQSGAQMFADRFTYLAAVPFSVLIASFLSRVVRFRRLAVASFAAVLFLFGIQSTVWCKSWKNSLALWECALAVDQSNPQAYNSAGIALKQKGQYERAIRYFCKAIQLNPGYVQAWHNRSISLAITGDYERALEGWEIALSLPNVSHHDFVRMLWVRGWVLEEIGDVGHALADYTKVIEDARVMPDLRAGVLLLRAGLYLKSDDLDSAQKDAEKILSLPDPFGRRHAEAVELMREIRQ